MKRILIAFIAALVCFSAAFSVSATDISNKKTENKAVALLSALDILRGDGSGDYMLDKGVNRAEFTAFVIRLMGLEDGAGSFDGTTQFVDVPDSHWAKGVIAMASNMGLIQGVGNGYFEPDRGVTRNEAVKILVSVLGYQPFAERDGGFPDGYNKMAYEIDLFKKISLSKGTYLTRLDVCKLIYGALNAKVYDDISEKAEETGFEKFLNMSEISGVITATPGYQRTKQLKGKIELDGNTYDCLDPLCDDYIGYNVKCYVQNYRGVETIYHIEPVFAEKTVVVDSDDISSSTTTSQFVYTDEDNGTKKLNLNSELSVFYNGGILFPHEVTNAMLRPESGCVTLRDGNGDGKYETILLDVYEDYVLTYINEERIYAKFGKSLDISEVEDIRVFKNGEEVTLDDLENGDVLSIMQSRNQEVLKIVASNDGATGYLYSISNKRNGQELYTLESDMEGETSFTLGKTYQNALQSKHPDATELYISAQRLLKVYFNNYGKVADVSVLSNDDDYNYGYLNGARNLSDRSLTDRFAVQILTSDNHFEVFENPENKKVLFGYPSNGEYKIAKASANMFVSSMKSKQLVRYKLDKDGYLAEIYKADPNPSQDHFSEGFIIKDSNLHFRDNVIDSKYYVDQNTKVFVIKQNREDLYCAGRYSDYMSSGSKYYLNLFDVRGTYVNALIMSSPVITTYDDVYGGKGYEVVIDKVNSPVLYINSVSRKLHTDGEFYTCLEGFQDGEEVSIFLSDTLRPNSEARSLIKPGIAIQYETNAYLTDRAQTKDEPEQIVLFKTVHDFTQTSPNGILWEYSDLKSTRSQITTLWGNVTAASNNHCLVETNVEPYMVSMHENTMILQYDSFNNKFTMEPLGAVNVGQNVFARQRYQNTRDVVIY